ncbi:unnamed protein product [Auanema sp. JU1783]|nr:unnamed protein product [Auanema sp. JU1783]
MRERIETYRVRQIKRGGLSPMDTRQLPSYFGLTEILLRTMAFCEPPMSSRSISSECFEMRNVQVASPTSIDIEMIGNEGMYYDNEFTPVMGKFGAPQCRCTPSLISLIGICIGMIIMTVGICLLIFFTHEQLFIPPGITLSCIGFLLLLIGTVFWTSEFMCDDCITKCFTKIQEAPMRNAIKRREERLRSQASGRVDSRISLNSRISRVSGATDATLVRY